MCLVLNGYQDRAVWIYKYKSIVNGIKGREFFSWRECPPVDQGLIIAASRSHSDTPRSVGLLWTSDQADAKDPTG
jgi:hypothetical protein